MFEPPRACRLYTSFSTLARGPVFGANYTDRKGALEEIDVFQKEYGQRYARAVETLTKDQDRMLTFFDFPAEHWLHLRTTNPIESTFATVKARTKKTKGAGSRKACQ
jgi:putative transposase